MLESLPNYDAWKLATPPSCEDAIPCGFCENCGSEVYYDDFGRVPELCDQCELKLEETDGNEN